MLRTRPCSMLRSHTALIGHRLPPRPRQCLASPVLAAPRLRRSMLGLASSRRLPTPARSPCGSSSARATTRAHSRGATPTVAHCSGQPCVAASAVGRRGSCSAAPYRRRRAQPPPLRPHRIPACFGLAWHSLRSRPGHDPRRSLATSALRRTAPDRAPLMVALVRRRCCLPPAVAHRPTASRAPAHARPSLAGALPCSLAIAHTPPGLRPVSHYPGAR